MAGMPSHSGTDISVSSTSSHRLRNESSSLGGLLMHTYIVAGRLSVTLTPRSSLGFLRKMKPLTVLKSPSEVKIMGLSEKTLSPMTVLVETWQRPPATVLASVTVAFMMSETSAFDMKLPCPLLSMI